MGTHSGLLRRNSHHSTGRGKPLLSDELKRSECVGETLGAGFGLFRPASRWRTLGTIIHSKIRICRFFLKPI